MKTLYYTLIVALFSYGALWSQSTSYGELNEGNPGDSGGIGNSYFGYAAGSNNTAVTTLL